MLNFTDFIEISLKLCSMEKLQFTNKMHVRNVLQPKKISSDQLYSIFN